MAILLDGDALAAEWRTRLLNHAAANGFARAGKRPCLATLLVGSDAASRAYVARKHADCAELGFSALAINLPATASEAEVLAAVARQNEDPDCHGVLVQFPLPAHLDAMAIQSAIVPQKDVDGLHPLNIGRMVCGLPGLRPCTPQGILALLQRYDVTLAGRRVAIIGRGLLTGRTLAILLADRTVDAVPTLLHRGAIDLEAAVRESDVIISAAGVPDLVTAAMIKPGACVVGVGITYVAGQMVSDIADDVAGTAAYVTPRHGSVGPMTRAMLMRNLLEAALASD